MAASASAFRPTRPDDAGHRLCVQLHRARSHALGWNTVPRTGSSRTEAALNASFEDETRLRIADRYELRSLIGRGGTASVHRAWDTTLERWVAIKVVRSESDAPRVHERQSEAKLLASLNHASLVTLYDAIATQDTTYLVMELMEGGTLNALCRHGSLAPASAASIASEIADALGYIHARGIIHRDIKPANILLTGPAPAVVSKLSDFGIAKLLETAPRSSTGVIGTAQYLSPEQARGDRLTPASDVYSLGLTILEALTGTPAFPGGPPESMMARLLRDPEIPGWLGYEWRSLLTAMTARDAASRPDAQLVAQRTRTLATDEQQTSFSERTEPIPIRPPREEATLPSPPGLPTQHEAVQRPPRRRASAIGGVVLAALIAAGVLIGALGPVRSGEGAKVRPAASAHVPADTRTPTPASMPASPAPGTLGAGASASADSATPSTTTSGARRTITRTPASTQSNGGGKSNGNGHSNGNGKSNGNGNSKGNGKG